MRPLVASAVYFAISAAQTAVALPLPVIIEVQREVEVRRSERLPDGSTRQLRGVLYSTEAFHLRKGQRLQMVKVYSEGECRIRVEKREHDLSSCPWLPGFRDHQGDIFKVIEQRAK